MDEKKIIFFRNDDVRDTLDESLIKLTEIFVENKIPITHAVEPANLTPKVIDWLLATKEANPGIIEIIQHGYDHKLNYQRMIGGKLKKGEYGGLMSYDEQREKIEKGLLLMDKYFGDKWFKGFTFPFGQRNLDSIKVLDDLNYKVVNGGVATSIKSKLFYALGRLLGQELLFGRKISWNLKNRVGGQLFQIDVAISVIKRYYNSEQDCEFFSLDEFIGEFNKSMSLKNIGVLFHHRYHNTQAKIDLVRDYISWIKTLDKIEFSTQENIHNKFNGKK